ncbi:MAG: chloride channel protein [Pyrinomonadaceae bacterium]
MRLRWRRLKLRVLGAFDRVLPSESQRVFALTLIVGAACGVAAVAFHLSIIWAEELLISRATASEHYGWLAILTPVAGGLLGGALLTYVVPGARGSGIPQVKTAFAVKGGRLPLRDVIGKFLIGVVQIGSGASLGREGPTVHICAGLASVLGRTFALSQKNLKRLLPVGAAAGIAAAFNAPIAAVTFTIEEVVGDLDQTVLSGVIVAAAIAAAIERGILGEHPVFTIVESYGLRHASSLFFYALLGIAGGGVSLAFSESLLRLRSGFKSLSFIPEWMKPAIGGLVTGILIVIAIRFLGANGINGGGYDTLSTALAGTLPLKVLAALCVMKLVATVFSYSSGGAGGIFAPALFIGGMLGGIVGIIDKMALGHAENEVGAFALVGMGAVFAGVVRAPITSVLIIFEMTGSYGLILPLMIANMTSYALARHFRPLPIYDALLEQDNIRLPHGGRGIGKLLEEMRVGEVFCEDAAVLDSDLTVSEAYRLVQDHDFTTFPVIDADTRCVGVVTEMRLRRHIAAGQGSKPLPEIVRRPHVIFPYEPLSTAVVRMNSASIRQLSVVDEEGRFLGILTMSDIVRAQANVLAPLTEAST